MNCMNYFKRGKYFAGYIIALVICLYLISCGKQDSLYKRFIEDGTYIYTGKVDSIEAFPGKNRIVLQWIITDPNITECVIYWDNKSDSTTVPIKNVTRIDTVHVIIDSLTEGSHEFEIYTYDNKGNSSVNASIITSVFGAKYNAGLLNRFVKGLEFKNGSLIITWDKPDTINITTRVEYTDRLNQTRSVFLLPDINSLTITDWELGTTLYYKSSYVPQSTAIDTFLVSFYDSIRVSNIPVDKSLWKEALLPNDMVDNAFGSALPNIWNGVTGEAFPSSYYSNLKLPYTFTIDLGEIYSRLTEFSVWGVTDYTFNNVLGFEIWGIADTTGASTVLLPDNYGWVNESIEKGWTLLGNVERKDNGAGGFKIKLIQDPPPVRFIRLRVLHTLPSGTAQSTISEISFWFS